MRVLVADDDAVNRRVVCAFLEKWNYDALIAKDGNQAWELLQQPDAPQVAILDWMMPGLDGVEVCRRLRNANAEKYTYVILLTTKFQKEDVFQGLEAGADDYVTKPFDSGELRARLRAGERILSLQSDLLKAQTRLEHEASHDPLTGFWNRAAIIKILRAELSRSQRESSSMAVVSCDLDFFKRINDTYGHPAGDGVLRQTAERMMVSVRAYDSIGRVGGEEFLIVLPKTDLAGAAGQADRIRSAVGQAPMYLPEGKLTVTMSLGVASRLVPDPLQLDALLCDADRALYRSKQNGRNRVTIFSDHLFPGMSAVQEAAAEQLAPVNGPSPAPSLSR